jgi:anti-anti-sigma regulatory factor
MEPFQVTATESGSRIDLLPVMDLRVSPPFHATMVDLVARAKPLEIAAPDVERLSTPCIQVLLAAAQALEKAGTPFKIVAPSDAFIAAFDDLGLFPVIMKWRVE